MKILFITLSNIGDVILTLSVFSALKDSFQKEKIDVVVGPRAKEVFQKDPRVGNLFIYDKHANLKEKIAFIKKIRKKNYDLAVDMRASLIPLLIGARKRTSLILVDKSQPWHKRSVHLSKLKGLGIEYKKRQNIYIDDKDKDEVARLLGEHGIKKDDLLIGVSPTCRSLLKQWPSEGFIEVLKGLLHLGKHKVVLIGEGKKGHISKKIADAVNDKNLIDLTGKTNLNQLFALTERMQVLLTCDSASLHIACDLGVRTVAIFGPTDAREYGPTGKDDIVIKKDLKCAPCRKARCEFNNECMKKINAKEVLDAVKCLTLLR